MKHFALIIVMLLIASCTTPQTPPAPDPVATDTPQPDLPNPASVYCEAQGYRLEIRTAADDSQSGICIFPDGSECDEWAYYRGECSPPAHATETPTPIPPTPVYSPALATPDPAGYAGWIEYADANYGFRFYYPADWTAELDLRADSTSYGHLLWLRAPDKPLEGVVMTIAFERVAEDFGLQRTGIGSGELVERGSVLFLGVVTPRIALALEGYDLEILYNGTGLFERGDLRFAISLDYAGTERIGIPIELQQTADLIVASFEWAE